MGLAEQELGDHQKAADNLQDALARFRRLQQESPETDAMLQDEIAGIKPIGQRHHPQLDLPGNKQIEDIRCKQLPERNAEVSSISAEEALEWLLERRVLGVQVRYRYQDQVWSDTILAGAAGHRVVRMASPAQPAGLAS